METTSLLINFAFICVLGGGCCLLVTCAAIAYVVGTLNGHAAQLGQLTGRVVELEKLTTLKPNSRAAMERRDAYEEALFSVVKAQEEVEIARTRLDALTNILSQKAQGK